MLAGKKKIFAVLAAALILACSLTAFHPAAVSAEVTAGDLEVGAKDVKGVLGRTLTVPINIKNDSADWLYNLDLELVMENGLEIGSGGIAPHSVVFDGVSKEQRVFWKDVKDLAPDESYTFEVPVKILEKFKDEKGDPAGEVPFGYEIGSIFTLYGSNNSHLFYPNGGGVTQFVEFNVTPLPFTVEVNSPGKQVKGAGATADPGGDWNLFSYNIAIENNTREPSTIGSLSFLMANGIQVSNFTLSPDTNELDGEGRTLLDWGSIGLAAGGTKNITFKGAIFNKHTQGGNVNAGAVIEDGEALKSILSYSGYVNSTPDIDYLDDPESIAVAKDMIISKGVAPSSGIGYGSTLTYDLTVKTNEYYPVNNARVTDTLGDGQTFSLFSDMTVSGSVYGSVYQADPLIIVWDGGLPERSVARMTIKSTVDTEWSNGDPIVAGDRIRNGVECKGETVFESYDGEPPDSAVAVAAINKPLIDLQLLEKNGSPYTGDPAEVLVGDKLKYRLTYDASAVDARQKNVDIINFFPQGTKYVDASATFSPGWDGGALIKALALGNDHFWYNFGFIDKNKTLWVEYELEVIDDVIITDQKQACNLAKLSFENTPGVVDSEREGLSLTYGAPVLKIAKNADKTTGLVAGETVSFIITVTNDGGAPAYDVKVKDTLPLELKDITDISHGGSYDSGNGAVTYTVGSIGAKSSAVLTFKAKVADPVGAQYTMQNRAEITEYKKRSGGADYTVGSDVGLNLTTAEPAITKTVIAKSRENISMGDWVVYKISVTVPKATLYSAVVTDQKPGEHKFIELYSSYTDESNNTVYGAAYGIDGNTLTITGLGDLTGPITRDFYIKAMVNAYMASQTNTATVRWYDKETGGIQRNKQAQANVSVTQPTLTASWAGWTAKTGMKQGDSEPNTFRISNTGNTAYNFIPVITMPEELNASDFTGGTVVSNTVEDGVRTVTFQEVLSLGAGASYDIGMTISVDGVPVVGRPYAITGNTGTYYTTEGKTHSRSEASASAAITAAGMGISKTVTGSDNNGSKMEIRPGDRITYDIAVTVPKGTKAYDLRVTDTLPAELELVSSKYNGDPYTLGDVFESDSDASAEAKTYNITVVARAKTAVEYGVSSRKAEQNTAAVYWKQTVGGAESNSSSDISIDVVEPKLVIDSYTADKTAFADTGDSITFSASIKNNGQSTAHGIKVTAAIPSGMVIKEGTISAGGSIVGGNIVWTFASLDEAVSQDLSFTLSEDGDIFTPSEGSVALTINEYFSREDKGSSKKYGQVSSSKSIGQQSAISGIVFEDADGDGVKDPEEEAISGVTVTVTGSGGASHTLVTNAEGRYAVAVPAGSTAIAVASLSGSWRLTTGNASQTQNVAQGTVTYGEDVGFRKLGTVSGIVFEDKNGNGQQDAGESGIAGVKVRITESGSGMPEPDITTDANGAYSMAVPTGSTKVEILPAAGYVLTTPGKNDQTLTVNHNTETKADKSGYRAVGSVTGLVFEDADGDGIKDDSETGIAGVTVTITDMDGKVYTRTTGAGGTYTVDNIPVGTALVAVTGPEGYALTTAGKDSQTVMVGKNTVVNADNAGYKALGRIWGVIFNDANGDGVKQPGENGLSGVLLNITSSLGTVTAVTTGADGSYSQVVPLGSTGVTLAQAPAGYVLTTAAKGGTEAQTINVTNDNTPANDIGYNRRPGAVNDSYSVTAGQTLIINVPGILGNDTDAEENTLSAVSISGISDGTKGTLTANGDGSFTFQAGEDASGTVSFTYKANDGISDSTNTGTVTIYINRRPAAADDSYEVNEGETLIINAPGILGNDTDADGDALTAVSISGISDGTKGTLTANGDGSFTFGAASGSGNSSVTFTYKASDGKADSNTAAVTITINGIPAAAEDSYSMTEGETLILNILDNDSDAEGSPLTVQIIEGVPADKGTLTANGDGTFTFIAAPDAGRGNSSVTFTYRVYDGKAYSAPATVTIAVNSIPAAVNDSYSVIVGQTLIINAPGILGNDTDADGDALTAVSISGISDGTKGTLTANGDGSFTFVSNAAGTVSFTYKANDGKADSNTATVTINIISPSGDRDDSPSKPAPSKPAPPAEPGHETVGYRSTEPDILLKTTEDKEKPFMDYSKITVELPSGGKNGQAPKITVDDTGKVEAENLQKDTNYDFNIYFELEPGINVVIGHLNVKVDKDGNVEVEKALIDPYGVLTDTISGDVVPGAYIDLRYADTQRNRDNGILPDTRVALPKLEGFEPNNNINPQYSDMDGKYAYMVYPYTDYYILVRLPGYKDFKSPVISVEAEIVKFDIDFEPSEVRDPAVFISSGRNKIQGKTNVDIVLDYMNKSITDCENAVLSLVLPEGFTVVSAYGAEISGQKITWDLGTLKVGQKGSRYITLKAPEISQGEWIVNLDAAITADGKLYFREDDTSRLPLLVYSNRYTILHKRYIKGYPDFTFRPY
ncbi:MAG: Ig-like domain-containing protein, partial [Clostridiaceae bacterium]|nr:Ig-like domain-containing protein [Clostridiaceae bacterium]